MVKVFYEHAVDFVKIFDYLVLLLDLQPHKHTHLYSQIS